MTCTLRYIIVAAIMVVFCGASYAIERTAALPYRYNVTSLNIVPNCTSIQVVGVSGTAFVCRSYPSCGDNDYLTAKNGVLLCKPFPCTSGGWWNTTNTGSCNSTCGAGIQTVVQTDGCGNTRTVNQSCNTPGGLSWSTSSIGTCNASCGGGTQAVVQTDNCGNTRTLSQSCNMAACAPVPCGSYTENVSMGNCASYSIWTQNTACAGATFSRTKGVACPNGSALKQTASSLRNSVGMCMGEKGGGTGGTPQSTYKGQYGTVTYTCMIPPR